MLWINGGSGIGKFNIDCVKYAKGEWWVPITRWIKSLNASYQWVTFRFLVIFGISGGVSSINDIKKAKELKNNKIEGIIVGKAIYDGDISFEELVQEDA